MATKEKINLEGCTVSFSVLLNIKVGFANIIEKEDFCVLIGS